MWDNTKITWTAPKYSIEKLGIILFRDILNNTVIADYTNSSDIIAKKAEATAKLAITTSLTIPTYIYISAISIQNKQLVVLKIYIKLFKLIANTNIYQYSILINRVIGIQNY